MALKIYTINHPLVRNWSSYLFNVKVKFNDKKEIFNQLYSSLLYEAMRKSVQTIDLYLLKLNNISEISLLPKKKQCTVLSEINLLQTLGQNIYKLIPHVTIWPFQSNYNEYLNKETINFIDSLIPIQYNSNIIVLETDLNDEIIFSIFNLILNKKITIDQVLIICLTCSKDTLQKINKNYTNINLIIYTTKIIENNNNQEIKHLLHRNIV